MLTDLNWCSCAGMQLDDQSTVCAFESADVWGNMTLHDVFEASVTAHPDRPAVVDPYNTSTLIGRHPETMTYADVDHAAEAVARRLDEVGIVSDDIVVVQLPNTWELAVLFLAVNRLNAILSPVPIEWRRRELQHVFDITNAALYIGSPKYSDFTPLEIAREIRSDPEMTIQSREWVYEIATCSSSGSPPTREINPEDVFNIQWTSGTTAKPKACPMTHNNWLCDPASSLCDISDGARLLCPTPLVNMSGIGVVYIPWIRTGGTLVLHHPFDLELLIEQLEVEAIDFTILVPTVLSRILKHDDVDSFDLSGIETIATGSDTPATWALKEFNDRWGIDIINIWGQNEGTYLLSTPATTPIERRSTDFPLFDSDHKWNVDHTPTAEHTRVKLVDPDTRDELPEKPGKVGELAFRGPITMPEYFNQPEYTNTAFDDDGFFYSGDLFEFTGDGYIRFVDRKKDVVIRGGHTISTKEIENVVLDHAHVRDAAAIGVPDEDLGERVCLCIVPRDDANPSIQELEDWFEGVLARYKHPEQVETVDKIPRNSVGKVKKQLLRQQFA